MFKKNIFTESKICNAFLVIKPNGEFYTFYGGDHFSIVEILLKSQDWKEGKILEEYIKKLK
ncbi:MAG: hypothetical protein JKY02_11155 [Flavobacteriaceae bacterium]|nr:hypothetical protein [Flavobacteriaceae bacterium]